MSNRKVKSIRGEVVDFDLFAIKQQILTSPKTDSATKRERFIDKKRRRTTRNTVSELVAQQSKNEAVVREAMAKKVDVTPSTEEVTTSTVTESVTTETQKTVQKIIK